MIPRTVQAAKAVAATFTTPQLDAYGNIILNGYATTGPNTTGKLAWQYKETTGAPVPLPSVTSVQPALKGWTTNYMEYYTQLPPNAYGVNPGDPTMFEYDVHSFTAATGTILTLGALQAGTGYSVGSYTNVPTVGGSGVGATLDIVVGTGGVITSATLNNPGSGYAVGDGLTVTTLGTGYGFAISVTTITVVTPGNQPQWAQPPHRFYQNQVADFVPPNANQQAIQYSFVYPIADSPVPPPVDIL